MNGYWGKILKVDLGTGEIGVEEPPDSFYRRYMGGNGFVGYYLLKEVPKGADPLGPDNVLVFTGVPIAGAGRNVVGA
jgi:aldehyde:ferredoxin oxidoreductase